VLRVDVSNDGVGNAILMRARRVSVRGELLLDVTSSALEGTSPIDVPFTDDSPERVDMANESIAEERFVWR
jgi:hypothetical protein